MPRLQAEGSRSVPKHWVTHCQALQLPRLLGDGRHGFVRLLLEPRESFAALWTEDLADKWQKSPEDR